MVYLRHGNSCSSAQPPRRTTLTVPPNHVPKTPVQISRGLTEAGHSENYLHMVNLYDTRHFDTVDPMAGKSQEDPEVVREMEELMLLPREEREKEIGERFYKELEFGTGGLRGIMGAGPNRLNLYTVSRASRGYARYLKNSARRPGAAGAQETGAEELWRSGSHPEAPFQAPSLVIAYDTRIRSREFARRAAEVFAEEGIRVYLFDEPVPTPLLSYAVPRLGCCGGVVITASHNPAEYNGYKVYEKDGCQITGKTAAAIYAQIVKLGYFDGCEAAEGGSREKAAESRDAASGPQASCQPITPVPQSLIQGYLEEAAAQAFGGRWTEDFGLCTLP